MATSTTNNTHIIEPQLATDMDIEVYGHDGIHFNRYDNNTAHTPYKEGLTLAAEGFAVTFMHGDYGSQTVYPNGQVIFYRRDIYYSDGMRVAGQWKSITPT